MRMSYLSLVVMCWVLLSCSAGYDEAQGLQNAIKYFGDGNYRSSEIELKQVLSVDAENIEARFLLAKTFYEMNEYSHAETEAERYIKDGGDRAKAYEVLLKSYLHQGEQDRALGLDVTELLEKGGRDLELWQANAHTINGDYAKSEDIISSYYENHGETPTFLLVKANLLASLGQYEAAAESAEKHVATAKQPYSALILLGDLQALENKNQNAEEYYSKAIDQNAYLFEAYMKRAVVRIQQEKLDLAGKDLQKVYKRYPESVNANYMIGMLAYLKGDFEGAEKAFEYTSPAYQRYPDSLFYLGQISFQRGEYIKSEDYLRRYLSVVPESVPAIKMISMINFSRGDFETVEKDLASVSGNDDTELNNIRAGALLESGDTERSVQIYKNISELNPVSDVAKVNLGVGYLRSGDYDNSISTLKSISPESSEDPEISKLLVMNYIGKKDFKSAKEVADQFVENHPDKVDGYNMKGMVDLVEGNLNQAKDHFIKARSINPKDPFSSNNLAKIYLASKEGEKALSVYESLLDNDSPESYLNVAKVKLLLGDTEGFLSSVNKSIELDSEYAPPRLVLAEYYFSHRELEKLPSAFVGSETITDHPEYQKVMYLYEFERGEFEQAIRYLEKMESASVSNKEVIYYNLSKTYAALGKNAETASYLDQSYAANSEYFPAILALARTHIASRQWDESEKYIAKLEAKYLESPDALSVLAAFYDGKGDYPKALSYSKTAFEKDSNREKLLILASRYWKAGKTDEATGLVETWLLENPDDNYSREALSDFYLSVGNNDLAKKNLESIIRYDEKNVAALNNLAWILKDSKPDEAVKYAEQANQILPDTPEVLDTLAMTYLSAGKIDKAWGSIRKAASMRPDNSSILYHSALIASKAGKQDYSLLTLKELMIEGKSFPERDSAEQLLNKLSAYQ